MGIAIDAAAFQITPAVFNSPNIDAKMRKAILCTIKGYSSGYFGASGHKSAVISARNFIAPMPQLRRDAARVSIWLSVINANLAAALTTSLNGSTGLVALSQDFAQQDMETLDMVDLFLTAKILSASMNG